MPTASSTFFKTNFSTDTNDLCHNNGDGTFNDLTRRAVQTRYIKWGTAFVDIDNDGWKDLIVAAGHVYPPSTNTASARSTASPARSTGTAATASSTTCPRPPAQPSPPIPHAASPSPTSTTTAPNRSSSSTSSNRHRCSRTRAPGANALALLIRALTATARDAIGARITVTTGKHTQIDEGRRGGSFISHSDLRVHFGLGSAPAADIRWPQGATGTSEPSPPISAQTCA